MFKRGLFILALALAAAGALAGARSSTANAAFDYGVVNATDGFVGAGSVCSDKFVTMANYDPFNSANPSYYQKDWLYTDGGYRSQLDTMAGDNAASKSAGSGWAAYYTANTGSANGGTITYITFDPTTKFTIAPYMVGGSPYPGAYHLNADHTMKIYTISVNANAGCRLQGSYGEATVINGDNNNPGTVPQWLYISTDPANISYPSDYGNSPIPQTFTIHLAAAHKPKDSQPDMAMQDMSNWHGNFYDKTFYTFDLPPWQCDDGFDPILNIEVWSHYDGEIPVKLATGSTGANGLFTYDFPKKEDGFYKYQIISWYSCTDGSFDFANHSYFNFTIDNKGNIMAMMDVSSCMRTDFPFVNVDGCMTTMAGVFQYLVFHRIKLPDWQYNADCHQLTTMGSWLHLTGSNSYVCAQVPAEVRNTVTPFVAFMLGIVTLGLLKRRGELNG